MVVVSGQENIASTIIQKAQVTGGAQALGVYTSSGGTVLMGFGLECSLGYIAHSEPSLSVHNLTRRREVTHFSDVL